MVAVAVAVLSLGSSDPSLAFVAATWVVSALVAWFAYAYLRRERERAAAGDHVVETTRDVAAPDHCVGCGRAHPPMALAFRPMRIGVSRIAAAIDPRFRRLYRFPLCRACAAPIVRLRRVGMSFITVGALLLVALTPSFLFAARNAREGSYATFAAYLDGALLCVMVGCTAIIAGLLVHTRAGSSTVSILDSGGETLLFRFRSQVYRNHFAERNGER